MKYLYFFLLTGLLLSAQEKTAADSIKITGGIKEVIVAARQQSKAVTVGGGTRKKALLWPYTPESTMIATHFCWEESYTTTPYIQSVTVHTRNKTKSGGNFKLHLYKMGADSLPGEELVPNGIMAKAKSGSRATKVELSVYNLALPKEGVIVGYEWLKVDENMYGYEATGAIEDGALKIADKKDRVLTPAPDVYLNDVLRATTYFFSDKWHKLQRNTWARHQGYFIRPAINMTLTN
ncbi:MAG: hypothetical protein V4581_15500 [Bacteroidota bacterium]